MGDINAPVLKDLFGEEVLHNPNATKFFRMDKWESGTRIESIELEDSSCPHCHRKIDAQAETEMDFQEETERHLVRLCLDEMEGRE